MASNKAAQVGSSLQVPNSKPQGFSPLQKSRVGSSLHASFLHYKVVLHSTLALQAALLAFLSTSVAAFFIASNKAAQSVSFLQVKASDLQGPYFLHKSESGFS
jgi:hypothetical protein